MLPVPQTAHLTPAVPVAAGPAPSLNPSLPSPGANPLQNTPNITGSQIVVAVTPPLSLDQSAKKSIISRLSFVPRTVCGVLGGLGALATIIVARPAFEALHVTTWQAWFSYCQNLQQTNQTLSPKCLSVLNDPPSSAIRPRVIARLDTRSALGQGSYGGASATTAVVAWAISQWDVLDWYKCLMRWFVAALLTLLALWFAVRPEDTVAIQCISGRSIGRFFVLNGFLNDKSRYQGMKKALGKENELFVPARLGADNTGHPTLTRDDYDMLVETTCRKLDQRRRGTAQNTFLSSHTSLPLWNWAIYQRYGWKRTAVAGIAALGLLPLLSLVRASVDRDFTGEIILVVLLAVVKIYDTRLLDIDRACGWVRVHEPNVSETHRASWRVLFQTAMFGYPNSGRDAVTELAQGVVRKHGEALLIPIMLVKPRMGYRQYRNLLLVRYAPVAVLACSSFGFYTMSYPWIMAYGILTWVQAFLQAEYASGFVYAASPHNVPWVRELPDHIYGELVDRRYTLK